MSDNGQGRNSNRSEVTETSGLFISDQGADSSLVSIREPVFDPLLTPEQVAQRLNVSPDWVRDHSSRKEPRLPVIRLGGGPGRAGLLRYRASRIENFLEEMESLSRSSSRRI
jgi:hypothetical protein